MAHLFRSNLKQASIQNYESAIAYYQKISLVSDPTANLKVQKFLLGAKILSPLSRQLQPVMLDILFSILGALLKINQTHYNVKMQIYSLRT